MDQKEQTVVVELKVLMLRTYPADWDAEMINFHLNDSSHCRGTEIAELAASDKADEETCDTCHRAEGHFLRVATPDDLERLKLRVPAGMVIDIEPERQQIAGPTA